MENLLTSPRLSFRHLKEDDDQKLLEMSQEQSLKKWLPDQVYKDLQHSREVLSFLMDSHSSEGPHIAPFVYGICQGDELIGHIGLSPWQGSVEIGFAIEECWQGKGLAQESLQYFCPWAIENFELNEIYAVVATANQPSLKCLNRVGFQTIDKKSINYHGREEQVQVMRFSLE